MDRLTGSDHSRPGDKRRLQTAVQFTMFTIYHVNLWLVFIVAMLELAGGMTPTIIQAKS